MKLETLIRQRFAIYLLTSFVFIIAASIFASPHFFMPPSSTLALQFDGSSYVEVPNSDSLNISGSLTIQFWARPFDRRNGRVLVKGSYYNSNYFTSWRGDGMMEFIITDESGEWSQNHILTSVLEPDTWYFIAFVFDKTAGVMRGYVNGELISELSVGSLNPLTGDWPVRIGAEEGGGNGFCGLIDEVSICNRALSRGEINESMSGHNASEGLVGWWKLEEGSGNAIGDGSSYHNDGVIHQAEWKKLSGSEKSVKLLNLAAVEYVVLRSDVFPEWQSYAVNFWTTYGYPKAFDILQAQKNLELVRDFRNASLWKNVNILPHIFGTDKVIYVEGLEDYNFLSSLTQFEDFDPQSAIFFSTSLSPQQDNFILSQSRRNLTLYILNQDVAPTSNYLKGYLATAENTMGKGIINVTFEKLDPSKYIVHVQAEKPFFLIFSESFNTDWTAQINGKSVDKHFMVNGYANAWYIDPNEIDKDGEFTITLYFWPQSLFYLGAVISLTTLGICMVYLFRDRVKGFYGFIRKGVHRAQRWLESGQK